MPNVTFFFNHKLTGADFKKKKAWFEVKSPKTAPDARDREVEIDFDFLIGADGAHSSARYHMMKYTRMNYQQEYIDTLWCEFTIAAKGLRPTEDPENRFRISPHHLHIWPGKEFMFIAIPSYVCYPSLTKKKTSLTDYRMDLSHAHSSSPPHTSPSLNPIPVASLSSSTPTSQV
jgi:2-polyprenyl-6-methoxyphenol hydroxylase-like FAD-dependent oxidoreductase